MATHQDGLSDVFEQIQYISLMQLTLSIAGSWEAVRVFIYVHEYSLSQPEFTCSKLTIDTLEQCVEYV